MNEHLRPRAVTGGFVLGLVLPWVTVQGQFWGTGDVGLPLPYKQNHSLLTSIRFPDFGSKQRDGFRSFPAWGAGK